MTLPLGSEANGTHPQFLLTPESRRTMAFCNVEPDTLVLVAGNSHGSEIRRGIWYIVVW
jgi:hypothetical protein